jgi:hypothetical protein
MSEAEAAEAAAEAAEAAEAAAASLSRGLAESSSWGLRGEAS